MKNIRVSEHFYSIQGEGPSVGIPAVFLRLQGCNMNCGQKNAKWHCDTESVWKQGTTHLTELFFNQFYSTYKNAFTKGARLVITGGEPLLQQSALIEFLTYFRNKPIIEVETNGSICPTPEFSKLVNQWNISFKLSNSGESQKKRINPSAVEFFKMTKTAIYKFVVYSEHDITEILNQYPFIAFIPLHQKFLMPAAACKKDLDSSYPKVVEWCKSHGFSLSQRLHLTIWDQATGV
jgi:7-carboxy-7-deazaguanine synthase